MAFFPVIDNPKLISFIVIILFAFLYYQYRWLHVETSSIKKNMTSFVQQFFGQKEQEAEEAARRDEDMRLVEEQDERPYPFNVIPRADPEVASRMQNERAVRDERKIASEQPRLQHMLHSGRRTPENSDLHQANPEQTRRPPSGLTTRQSQNVVQKIVAFNSTSTQDDEIDFDSVGEGGLESKYK